MERLNAWLKQLSIIFANLYLDIPYVYCLHIRPACITLRPWIVINSILPCRVWLYIHCYVFNLATRQNHYLIHRVLFIYVASAIKVEFHFVFRMMLPNTQPTTVIFICCKSFRSSIGLSLRGQPLFFSMNLFRRSFWYGMFLDHGFKITLKLFSKVACHVFQLCGT